RLNNLRCNRKDLLACRIVVWTCKYSTTCTNSHNFCDCWIQLSEQQQSSRCEYKGCPCDNYSSENPKYLYFSLYNMRKLLPVAPSLLIVVALIPYANAQNNFTGSQMNMTGSQ